MPLPATNRFDQLHALEQQHQREVAAAAAEQARQAAADWRGWPSSGGSSNASNRRRSALPTTGAANLRPTEYRLLYHLVQNAGYVMTHEMRFATARVASTTTRPTICGYM